MMRFSGELSKFGLSLVSVRLKVRVIEAESQMS